MKCDILSKTVVKQILKYLFWSIDAKGLPKIAFTMPSMNSVLLVQEILIPCLNYTFLRKCQLESYFADPEFRLKIIWRLCFICRHKKFAGIFAGIKNAGGINANFAGIFAGIIAGIFVGINGHFSPRGTERFN